MLIRKQKILQFIAELKALVPLYRETWMAIALSCQSIKPEKAAAAIKTAYAVLDEPEPEICFCESPMAALEILCSRLERLEAGYSMSYFLEQQFWQLPRNNIENLLWECLGADCMKDGGEIQTIKVALGCGEKERQRRRLILDRRGYTADLVEAEQIETVLRWQELLWSDGLKSHLEKYFQKRTKDSGFGNAVITTHLDEQQLILRSCNHQAQKLWGAYGFPIQTGIWAYYACWLDLCTSVFDFTQLDDRWDALQEVVKQCGWFYPLKEFCIVCDRPRVLTLDHHGLLHSFNSQGVFDAEAEPAIQFADGLNLSAYHGKIANGVIPFF